MALNVLHKLSSCLVYLFYASQGLSFAGRLLLILASSNQHLGLMLGHLMNFSLDTLQGEKSLGI